MKTFTYKRKYLIKNPEEALLYLRAASPSYKSRIYQFYYDKNADLGVLSLRFDDEDAWQEVQNDAALNILQNVSEDKRYKNRYLKRFGFPDTYDFEIDEVYTKCDKLIDQPLELSLMSGMSTQKVLRVLLYDENNRLQRAVEQLLNDEGSALKRVYRHAKNMAYLLKIAPRIFDATLLRTLYRTLRPLVCSKRSSVLCYVQSEAYMQLCLDMHFFLTEKSGFYCLKQAEMPIGFFVKKYLKKERFKVAQQLKRALD